MQDHLIDSLKRRLDEFFASATDADIDALLERADAEFYNQFTENIFSAPVGMHRGLCGRLSVRAQAAAPRRWPHAGAFQAFARDGAGMSWFPVTA